MELTLETLFSWANGIAFIGWVFLLLIPRRQGPLFWVPQYVIPFGLGLVYSALILPQIFVADGGGFGSVQEVRAMFQNDAVLVGGWIHYLAFDLFIGSWIARNADDLGIPRLIQVPILAATFMLGPVGLVIFLAMRSLYRRPESP
ncbi:MAG: ABA4-like family protein [Xanthomonadales bacterium]|nr:ABA4-like family protein [Xanthomonadales bacterium]